jgi:uncharacterized membrane protein
MDNTQEIIELARRDVAARRATRDERADRPWLFAFVGIGLTLLLGVLFLPIRGLDYRLQMVVHGVCSQAHYLYVGALRLPLCARNTGIYAGTLGTLLGLLALGKRRAAGLPPVAITLLLVLGGLAMAIDGTNSLLLDLGGYNLYTPHNPLRVVTGLLMGTMIGVFVLLMFNVALRKAPTADERIISSWIEYAALLLIDLAVYLVIFFGPGFLYYPVALFSVIGIVGVLFVANIFVLAMVNGFEGKVTRLRQLTRPATIGLVLTAVELIALAGLRLWVEGSMIMPM